MRAIQLDFADRKFPASLVDVPRPDLPNDVWARIKVMAGGICGSDLHVFANDMGASPTLMGFTPFPFLLGHEIAGEVLEAGDDAGLEVGTRVAIQPTITCDARGIVPPCPHCAVGNIASCQRLDSKVVTPGMALGFTTNLGGGWAEEVLAHRSMLFPLPDEVTYQGASLHEPLSIVYHGLLRRPPEPGESMAVVGCGIIGLAVIAAAASLCPTVEITGIARHEHQAAVARACGADHTVIETPDGSYMTELASRSGTRVVGKPPDAMLGGGFRYTVDAVGSTGAVNSALRLTDQRGTVLILGAATSREYDLSPLWWKELNVIGSINHSFDPGPGGGPARHSVVRAVDLLATGVLPLDTLVSHDFALEDYRDAITTALDRRSGAIKVVFRPHG